MNIGGYQVCERAVEADATRECAHITRWDLRNLGVGETLPMTNSGQRKRSGGYPTEYALIGRLSTSGPSTIVTRRTLGLSWETRLAGIELGAARAA